MITVKQETPFYQEGQDLQDNVKAITPHLENVSILRLPEALE